MNFHMPIHNMPELCEGYTLSNTSCSRKHLIRFITKDKVNYSCGISCHMKQQIPHNTPYYVQRYFNKTWVDDSKPMFDHQCIVQTLSDQIAFQVRHGENSSDDHYSEDILSLKSKISSLESENKKLKNNNCELSRTVDAINIKYKADDKIHKSTTNRLLKELDTVTKQLSTLQLANLKKLKVNNEFEDKIQTCMKRIQSNGTLEKKQLMFKLHPDKHPSELSWLFNYMFKLIK